MLSNVRKCANTTLIFISNWTRNEFVRNNHVYCRSARLESYWDVTVSQRGDLAERLCVDGSHPSDEPSDSPWESSRSHSWQYSSWEYSLVSHYIWWSLCLIPSVLLGPLQTTKLEGKSRLHCYENSSLSMKCVLYIQWKRLWLADRSRNSASIARTRKISAVNYSECRNLF